MLKKKHKKISLILITTIFLGAYFTIIQTIEYIQAPFTISDSIFGSSFFVATGFHGVHVLVGTIILTTTLVRRKKNQNSAKHHFGFEARA
jgi:cytochrome c oxidase subunit 3